MLSKHSAARRSRSLSEQSCCTVQWLSDRARLHGQSIPCLSALASRSCICTLSSSSFSDFTCTQHASRVSSNHSRSFMHVHSPLLGPPHLLSSPLLTRLPDQQSAACAAMPRHVLMRRQTAEPMPIRTYLYTPSCFSSFCFRSSNCVRFSACCSRDDCSCVARFRSLVGKKANYLYVHIHASSRYAISK